MITVEYILPGDHATMGHSERLRRLKRLALLARVMDTAIRIPGTGIRFGADSVMGLMPLVGDAGGALVGLLIINEARRMGVPRNLLLKMAYNVGVDTVVGAVPVAGDVFDVYFKSHKRNVNIIHEHFGVRPDRA
ncbi:DUF4112 domain-containing protein [Aureimonas fodinaquatilis]|uniref:DUF4112 domain-containing protein n=1 Tax=Aureimonas fodinaquatilis TaxID=2565783 RepID=A0A5B0E475_9HYPH|nr:DUF4112 domain-containing protein [Aureimonas fodinaquatilis]KAA0972570.1 DUF4112 domain-containing protein [Aureimonas fodinaquatilis]